MAIVKGICKNFGECDLADNKEVQEVDKTNFVCEECGKPLHPIEGGGGKKKGSRGGSNGKLIGIITAILVVLAGGGFGAYSLFRSPAIDRIMLNKKTVSLNVGQKINLKASVVDKAGKEINDVNVIYKWSVADKQVASVTQKGEVTALSAGKTSIIVKTQGNVKFFVTCQVEVRDTITVDTITYVNPDTDKPTNERKKNGKGNYPRPLQPSPKVSWGIYSGPPNGLGGTIKVTRSYSLNLHDDGEPLPLSPGDEIQNTTFTHGELRGGVWVHDGYRTPFNR